MVLPQFIDYNGGMDYLNSQISEELTLKQAVGRGVRSVDDKCVICILDERLCSATYKNKVLSSFKYKKTATRNLDKVKNFINDNR